MKFTAMDINLKDELKETKEHYSSDNNILFKFIETNSKLLNDLP